MDITENVWIGLSKTAERPNYMWTDFRPLTGDGHWQQAPPIGNDPLCVTMDPAADFMWKPMSCGGPEVASFICELPVPSWAMGPRGCLMTELPSLTVLYIPEQLALELTSDCGLDGTKRITCKGNADREDILKQLTCAIPSDDFEDRTSTATTKSSPSVQTVNQTTSLSSTTSIPSGSSSSSPGASSAASPAATIRPAAPIIVETSSEDSSNALANGKTTKPWIWTSNTIDIDDYDGGAGMPTRNRRETEDTPSPTSTKSTTDLSVQEAGRRSTTTKSSDGNKSVDEVTEIPRRKDLEVSEIDEVTTIAPQKSNLDPSVITASPSPAKSSALGNIRTGIETIEKEIENYELRPTELPELLLLNTTTITQNPRNKDISDKSSSPEDQKKTNQVESMAAAVLSGSSVAVVSTTGSSSESGAPGNDGASATMATSVSATGQADDSGSVATAGEYPSAINQGQLFSIIENGTMFDIIELNETSDDIKPAKETIVQSPQELLPSSTTISAYHSTEAKNNDKLFTTVVYNKEPPSESTFVTNKSVKKTEKQSVPKKTQEHNKEKDQKKVDQFTPEKAAKPKAKPVVDLESQQDDRTLTREFEMFPIMTDPMAKLNRTNRKELPKMEDDPEAEDNLEQGGSYGVPRVLDFQTDNTLNEGNKEHQHIEIKLHQEGDKNATHSTFFVTTKRADVSRKVESTTNRTEKKNSIEDFNSTNTGSGKAIDPKIYVLNNNTTGENNESEPVVPSANKLDKIQDSSLQAKHILEDSLDRSYTIGEVSPSEEPLEPEPQAQPRPNRQRQLTRPQRRSFYPYFFSRVLG